MELSQALRELGEVTPSKSATRCESEAHLPLRFLPRTVGTLSSRNGQNSKAMCLRGHFGPQTKARNLKNPSE
jgi:hypothetical protein